MTRLHLGLYRWAWILALPWISGFAWLDRLTRAVSRRGVLPASWRVRERLGLHWPSQQVGTRRGRPGTLWLHCASLGEAKGLWALAESLDRIGALILTATTAEGYAYLAERCASDPVVSASVANGRRLRASIAPLDHPGLIRRFLSAHDVIGLCLYEVELWPNTLAVCKASGLPVALVSGRLTAKAARQYRRFGGAGASLLEGLAWIQAQSPADAERFSALTGTDILPGFDFKAAHYLHPDDTGADPMASRERPGAKADAKIVAKEPERTRFAFVSLHFAELQRLLPGLLELMRRTDVIIFPRKLREIERFRSLLEPQGFALHSRDPRARYLLVDSMGLIAGLLPECHSAFVGGSLIPIGCHNLWEPLMAGAKIHFGPFHHHQESLSGRAIAAGIAEVLEDPCRIASLDAPGPEIPAACRRLARSLREGLDSALAEGGERIFATFYPDLNAWRDGESTLAAGIDKGQER